MWVGPLCKIGYSSTRDAREELLAACCCRCVVVVAQPALAHRHDKRARVNRSIMDAEQLTVLLVVVSHCSLTPFVMSRHLKVALPAVALLLLCVAFLMTARGVNLMLYTHYVPGISALIVSREILCGDGTCVNTQRIIGPAIIFVQEAFISQYLAIKVYSSSFYSLSHNLLHIIAAGWMLSLVLDHAFRRFWPARLHAFRLARQVHDPSVMACLGVAMIAHQHDETPIGEFFHNTWGSMFLAMAATHLLSSLVHAVQPVEAPASVLARGLHSFCWVANGLWACLMGIWMNLWCDGSLALKARTRRNSDCP